LLLLVSLTHHSLPSCLFPSQTVDMPVFFFIDPEILQDRQVSYVKSVTLSYTFFQTDEDDEHGNEDEAV